VAGGEKLLVRACPRAGPRLRSGPSKLVGEHYAHYTLWLDPGPDLDEEKVAEFIAMCASTGAPATPATAT